MGPIQNIKGSKRKNVQQEKEVKNSVTVQKEIKPFSIQELKV